MGAGPGSTKRWCAATGMGVKVRPDLVIARPKTGRVVPMAFKTTGSPDYAHFCATIEHDDRQARPILRPVRSRPIYYYRRAETAPQRG